MSTIATVTGKRQQDDASVDAVKRKKTESAATTPSSFRAWSEDADKDNSTTFTLKCTYDDLPSLKSAKVGEIKAMLKARNLSTDGKKDVLLERLQRERPRVTFDIDSRECLQRIVNAVMFHFKWDNMHLFRCRLPARGTIKDGTENKWFQLFGVDFGLALKMGSVDSNPYNHDARMRKHIQKKLDSAGMKWSDIDVAKRNKDAMGPWRNLMGSGFDPSHTNSRYEMDLDDYAAGGHYSLDELVLQKGDTIKLTYDLGDRNKFSILVEDVKTEQPLLLDVNMLGHETRAKIVEKSKAKISNQYSRTR